MYESSELPFYRIREKFSGFLSLGRFLFPFLGKKRAHLKPHFQILVWHFDSHLPSLVWNKALSWILFPGSHLMPTFGRSQMSRYVAIQAGNIYWWLGNKNDIYSVCCAVADLSHLTQLCPHYYLDVGMSSLLTRRANQYKIKIFSLLVCSTHPSFSLSLIWPVTSMSFC